MMGHLIINHLTLSFEDEKVDHKLSLINFLDAGSHARKNGDVIHTTKELAVHTYSWGNFYGDLAYSSWANINSKPFWSWMPQTLHQIMINFFYQNPSGRSDFINIENFKEIFISHNNGVIGCYNLTGSELDVHNTETWQRWRIGYFTINQEKFSWSEEHDSFLPNKTYTNNILVDILKSEDKSSKIVEEKVGVAFHEEIMKHKGAELQAYAVEIGSKVAEANFYKFEDALSAAEQKATGSPRKIFSLINRDKKKNYISIDHAHGMFEYHDEKGTHLGEYKFDGSPNKPANPSHNLRTL